ncbi:MAG: RluA family pseudouridine synthase [Treponema sp.]|nr:RluA family pseudouridine synthase [Treponema sp.]
MPVFSRTIREQVPQGLRLDRYVCEFLSLLSRSQIKARSLEAKVNGKNVKLSRHVKHGDFLELSWLDAPPVQIIPQDIPLDIVFENERVVVINKSQGMVVHPGAGNRQGTLANALYYRRIKKHGEDCAAGLRPGIVHRLDKETSGVIIAAYDDEALVFLANQFKARKTIKTYIAIIQGTPKEPKGRIETFVARDTRDRKRFTVSPHGRSALTFYKVIKSWGSHSLVLLRPKTGRTHQLRVHMRFLGYPILGDSVYGFNDRHFPDAALMLHSKSLAVTLPGEQQARVFKSPMPERFACIIEKLNGGLFSHVAGERGGHE